MLQYAAMDAVEALAVPWVRRREHFEHPALLLQYFEKTGQERSDSLIAPKLC